MFYLIFNIFYLKKKQNINSTFWSEVVPLLKCQVLVVILALKPKPQMFNKLKKKIELVAILLQTN